VRVLVTGATGFAGPWLIRELEAAGHEAIGTPGSAELDITDVAAVGAFVSSARPDAIAHLAGVSYGPEARRDPARALAVNAGGTRAVLTAAMTLGRDRSRSVPVLVTSSSEVYGTPASADLPLRESAPLATTQPYGLSKLAQERVAFEFDAEADVEVVVTRAFNHTGPGQHPRFVVPALAGRIIAAATDGTKRIEAGNVDVLRDFSDVRDVVRAYRLLVEGLASSRLGESPHIYNVASGKAVAIREIIERLAALVGIQVEVVVDPALVRTDDATEIRGDATHVSQEVGWHPSIPLDVTLGDILGWSRAAGS
jgi:GDP-4-dehydro-6-deoxy-D-mannose reductase